MYRLGLYRLLCTSKVAYLPSTDCGIHTLLYVLRFLEDRVKSQKSPQVEEGGGAMGTGREAKPEGNVTMLRRLISFLFSFCLLLNYARKIFCFA